MSSRKVRGNANVRTGSDASQVRADSSATVGKSASSANSPKNERANVSRASARERHNALAVAKEQTVVHPATMPFAFIGLVAGFFVGRLFGWALGGGILVALAIGAVLLCAKRPAWKEPAVASMAAAVIGFVAILFVAWLNH